MGVVCGVAGGCGRFAPHRAIDPDFAEALGDAARAGVEVWAIWSDIGPKGMWLKGWTPWRPG
ncbi:protein of unknown function [Kyrpidia spormannii]|uniref:Uncharacterized protein n=1 Tax=Kyrpidia spormannii TaxID=2055160 RepID=A0ACA8ZBN5_9BACL|nr:protein of unknown function [Kyrpidia spormannii]